jgi:hypothetical protein
MAFPSLAHQDMRFLRFRQGNPALTDPLLALPPEVAPFVAAVLARPELHARLGAHQIPDDFFAAALTLAGELGVALDATALRAATTPDPLGLGRWGSAPVTLERWPGGDWLPAASVPGTGPSQFDWAWFGDKHLRESFYLDSARRAGALPFNLLCRTRTDLASVIADGPGDALPLAGLVFHMSRCGSTLLAQMLGAVPEHLVASEPEPLDAVLLWAWREQVPLAEAVPAVRAIVAALGRRRGTGAERFFVKLDAWHTLSLPLLRAAFPDVPWVYLFREPIEVMVSHQRMAGMQTVAGLMPAALFGIERGPDMSPLEYAARVLDAIGRAALDHWHLGGGLAIDYPDVAEAATGRIAAHFGLALTPAQRAAMRAAAGADAKTPDRSFVDDRAAKRAEADAAVAGAAQLLAGTHARLLDLAG